MATAAQWVEGARPRTLPAAVAPVLVGFGAAVADGHPVWWAALLALVVSLALQVGVNYANDYSDGVRGTDADRVGPFRLVGSGAAEPRSVKLAAFACFGLAAVVGLVLVAATGTWELLVVGALSIVAAWYYTGGRRPYGYRGLGEVSVFVFFGLVAVVGTTYVEVGHVTAAAVLGGIACGALACAILVANNLRDIPTDRVTGKRTLAVRLGDPRSRTLYRALVVLAFLVAAVLALVVSPWALVALAAVPLAAPPLRALAAGATGRELIAVLAGTGRLQLVYGVLLGAGLALAAA
ncbi:MAG TPA: 1,4-dihydroxy-2-naphthoate polyprenyltransferase [Motilibacteraceae bacterium]|nr:1,4-dihydroxy-2-naphthoate polyprenyltransferase [Motilibacteraceae bacterium]